MKEFPFKKIYPKKSLGQNFLVNSNTQDKLINFCQLKQDDMILEIGPGKGCLTEKIYPLVKQITAVELDQRLSQYLQQKFEGTNVKIIQGDILTFPISSLPKQIKVIGNLPYNISTPILELLIQYKHHISSIYIMVQLEYGQRMRAQPHSKTYGSLSCFVQYHYDIKLLCTIKNTHFNPVPKVQSCFLELIPKTDNLLSQDAEKIFLILIRFAFSQRRKKALNALANILEKETAIQIFNDLKISTSSRAENLSLTQYTALAEYLTQKKILTSP
ncbi:MAG: ribosomal RNA small subunit methyltransferase A [Candidatus Omnitrophica bacterium]|nr:ribosomal RNA small subunit methyltransferase A [Candidatus Omnitrophota bacterium]